MYILVIHTYIRAYIYMYIFIIDACALPGCGYSAEHSVGLQRGSGSRFTTQRRVCQAAHSAIVFSRGSTTAPWGSESHLKG